MLYNPDNIYGSIVNLYEIEDNSYFDTITFPPKSKHGNRIQNFEQIGMQDPFVPRAHQNPPESYQDMVYPDSRYSCEIFQGKSIYVPTAHMMLKMMSACIGIANSSELWFK